MKIKNNKFAIFWKALVIVFLNLSPLSISQAEQVSEEPAMDVADASEQRIIIRNVTFVDPSKEKKSGIANLIIINKLIDLVTQDDVIVGREDIIVDAQNGFILGTLKLGETANFMILDTDPHENIEALLDTKKHALLAIHNGIIILNNLKDENNISSSSPSKTKRAGWLAYTPPQTALLSFYKADNWNVYSNDDFSIAFGGAVALDRQLWLHQNTESSLQVGDNSLFDGGEIRALRFGIGGAIKFDSPWVYTIAGATNAFDKDYNTDESDDITFFDWRLDIPTAFGTTLSIGKQKEPISMERLMGMVFLPNQERSVVSDALLPSRNVGLVLSGGNNSQTVTWAGGIFNDWLDDPDGDDSIGENSTQFVARSTWLPYESEDESELIHLGFGYRYSNAKEDIRFASEPEFNRSPTYIDSGLFKAEQMSTYNYEASWRSGPYWVSSEFTRADIDAPSLNDPSFYGYHISAAWSLTGEMRGYNKKSGTFNPLPIARSVEQGGIGAWELTSRWSVFNGNDGDLSAGKTKILSVGIYWWLTQKFNLSINYRHIELERCSFISEICDFQGTSNGFNTRLLLLL